MKHKIFLTLSISLLFIISCKTKNNSSEFTKGDDNANIIIPEDTLKRTQIQWIDSIKDLGNLTQGGLVDISFRFKNIGTKPLSINSVVPGCGCTQAEKPNHLIQPGAEGLVKAKFNTEGQNGPVQKHITVISNTNPSNFELKFNATVAPKK